MLYFLGEGGVWCGRLGGGGEGGYRVNGVVWSFSGMRCGRCGLVEVLVRYCDGWWGVWRLWRVVLKVCVCVGRVVGVGVGVGCFFVGVGVGCVELM